MGKQYFLVGSSFGIEDQFDRFIRDGIWELDWHGQEEVAQYQKMLSYYDQMTEGDCIVIKSSYTKSKNLPFSNPLTVKVSTMNLKMKGTILENCQDGHRIRVAWEQDWQEKEWYFYTNRASIWRLNPKTNPQKVSALIDYIETGKDQDYDWFKKQSPAFQKKANQS
ncbi:hypothetical protein [Streptococcus loxodontisalivarius]|uniref:Uncharacterized protein n=1 Tax=Streptococcus loxodontisalivarius TaxID=1349415 RepID=A0ABS2PTE8_9STRE|nr:hypothetical protein [Streptococcus loxodontisalivarius]MBM7643323.1 hypothetical protein [Streptococcus loxodontisalivarius]